MPPLRDRKEDMPLLTKYFIEKYNKRENKHIQGISPEVEEEFYQYHWPGNIRELENAIERAITLTSETIIPLPVILPFVKKEGESNMFRDELLSLPYKDARKMALDTFNIKYVMNVLNKNNGNVTNAAKEIEIERQYLQRILKKYNIKSGQTK